jgi:hypothetical protein
MMRLACVERLDELLLAVPELVEGLLVEDPVAGERIATWLQEVEQQLATQQLPASATFATLRARLWSVRRGLRLPGLALAKAPTARNWRQVGTSAILDEATQTLNALVAPGRNAVLDAANAMRQAVELGRLREQVGGPVLPWHAPDELWSALLTDQDLTVLITGAVSVLGESDARTLLARAVAAAQGPTATSMATAPAVTLLSNAIEVT